MIESLKSPYAYFGGKSAVAPLVWEYLGDVPNFIDPFMGSCAFLLARPHSPKVETVNDKDHMVANFWRSTQDEKGCLIAAEYADHIVNECDLHSIHVWLTQSEEAKEFRKRMYNDPHYFDPKIAGWWCWGMACWIAGGWCSDMRKPTHKIPCLSGNRGVNAVSEKIPRLSGVAGTNKDVPDARPQLGDRYDIGRGVNKNKHASTCQERRDFIVNWFLRLRDRMRLVRVCCGDWIRVCNSDTTTTHHGITGIVFDPPYSISKDGKNIRAGGLYSNDDTEKVNSLVEDVRKYCLEKGVRKDFRIVLAGYEGEGHEVLEKEGWDVISWRTQGGYGNQGGKKENVNRGKERLWVSPHCLKFKYGIFKQAAKF